MGNKNQILRPPCAEEIIEPRHDRRKTDKIKYSQWYVLIRIKPGGGFESVDCFTPNEESERIDNGYPCNGSVQWDLILPIPIPGTVPEWDGF